MSISPEQKRSIRTNVHERLESGLPLTSAEMDIEREQNHVYEYMCHFEEAKLWLSAVVGKMVQDFDVELPKGIILAEVGKILEPEIVKKIFLDENLQYRHTDNINFFLQAILKRGLPSIFLFEVFDLYERRNIPRVIYCIHALAHFLNKKNIFPKISDLVGKLHFSNQQIQEKNEEINTAGLKLPHFKSIAQKLRDELVVPSYLIYFFKYFLYKQNIKEHQELKHNTFNILLQHELLLEKKEKIRNFLVQKIKEFLKMHKITILQAKLKSLLYIKAFNEIFYRKKTLTLFSLRFYIFLLFNTSKTHHSYESEMHKIHTKINKILNENFMHEKYIDELEMRISLLVNNKVTVSNMVMNKPTPKDLTLISQDTPHYKNITTIFYILQTNPRYLKEILFSIEDRDTFIINTIVPLFYFGHGTREECLVNKLIEHLLDTRDIEGSESSYTKNQPTDNILSLSPSAIICCKILTHFYRVSKESKNHALSISSIISNLSVLDLECDPVLIYKELYNSQPLREVALQDKEVKNIYITRLKTLRGVINSLLNILERNISTTPFILRYFLKQLFERKYSLYGIKNMFYEEFILPFIIASDCFDNKHVSKEVREKCVVVSQLMSVIVSEEGLNNEKEEGDLNEVILKGERDENNEKNYTYRDDRDDSLYSGRQRDSFLCESFGIFIPLVKFIREAASRFNEIIISLGNAEDLNEHYRFGGVSSSVRVQRACVSFTATEVNDILSIFKIYLENKESESKEEGSRDSNDSLYSLIGDTPLLKVDNNYPIKFYLNDPSLKKVEEKENLNNLISIVKYKMSVLLYFCFGKNILDVVLRESKEEEIIEYSVKNNILEKNYFKEIIGSEDGILEEDEGRNVEREYRNKEYREFVTNSNDEEYCTCDGERSLNDENNFNLSKKLPESLDELKSEILDTLNYLESVGILKKSNLYGDMLFMLANDVLVLRSINEERNTEMLVNKMTLNNLNMKNEYLQEKVRVHEEYLISFAEKMVGVKKKGFFKFEDSRISKLNKQSLYGTYIFSANKLKRKNVLLEIYNYNVNQYNGIFFLVLCDKPNLFGVEMYVMDVLVGDGVNVRLDELLRSRFKGVSDMDYCGVCRFSVKGVLELINECYIK